LEGSGRENSLSW